MTTAANAFVDAFVDVLGSQTTYGREYPTTQLAMASLEVALAIGHRQHVSDGGPGAPPAAICVGDAVEAPAFEPQDIAREIRRAVGATRNKLRRRYIEKVNVEESVYESYFDAVEYVLTSSFVPMRPAAPRAHELGSITLYEGLRLSMTDLSRDQYRFEHRVRIEYVSKCVRKELFDSLRPGAPA